jgi:hypothetical protein
MVSATALKPSLQTGPEQDQSVEKKIQQFRKFVRRRAGTRQKGDRERTSGAQIADFGFAACG